MKERRLSPGDLVELAPVWRTRSGTEFSNDNMQSGELALLIAVEDDFEFDATRTSAHLLVRWVRV